MEDQANKRDNQPVPNRKKERGKKVRNKRYYGAGVGSVVGIKYQEVTKVVGKGDDDWKRFIQINSQEITQKGQLLIQRAVESFVYSVLAAQVKTRWAIFGGGAKSLLGQKMFNEPR